MRVIRYVIFTLISSVVQGQTINGIPNQVLSGVGVGFVNPGGRLTLSSGSCIPASDLTAQGMIYYTACANGYISLYNGTSWTQVAFTNNVSLSLSGIVSTKIYDVFGCLSAGDLSLELSTAWTNNTTRASALALKNGVTVQASDNCLLLGTIYATGSGVTSDSAGGTVTQVGGVRGVWNAYNKAILPASVIDTTTSPWSLTGVSVIRPVNNASGNQITYVSGETSEDVTAIALANCYVYNSSAVVTIGVGIDSTTTYSGRVGGIFNTTPTTVTAVLSGLSGNYQGRPGIGFHTISWNESGGGTTGTALCYGSGSQYYQAGLTVQLFQ